jgi:hypothetical protein
MLLKMATRDDKMHCESLAKPANKGGGKENPVVGLNDAEYLGGDGEGGRC